MQIRQDQEGRRITRLKEIPRPPEDDPCPCPYPLPVYLTVPSLILSFPLLTVTAFRCKMTAVASDTPATSNKYYCCNYFSAPTDS